MTVRELIEALSKHDLDAEIEVADDFVVRIKDSIPIEMILTWSDDDQKQRL